MCSFDLHFLLWGINSCILQNSPTRDGLNRKGHSSLPEIWVMSPVIPSLRGKHLQPDLQNSSVPIWLWKQLCLTKDWSSLGKTELCIQLVPSRTCPQGDLCHPPLADYHVRVKQEQHCIEFC